jgi:tape measure domain-containing protein
MANNSVEYILSLKDKFSSGIKSATSNTEKLNGAVNQAQRSISGLGGALGIGLGAAGIVSFGREVVKSLVNYEYFSSSLRTLMQGDAQAAKALENQLIETAKTTPFSLVEVQDATKQLLAYGFSASKVVTNIRMLGDVASALKIPFGDIAYLYGTLKTQGRAFSKDINQFTGRGIPIVKELAKQFGVADSEVMKLVESGKVGFAEVEKAFQSMTTEGGMFFNMMAEQTKTTGGQISALGDSYEQLKVNIGKSQSGIIASTVSFVGEATAALEKYFRDANSMFENFAKNGAKQFGFWEKAAHETIGLVTGYHLGYAKMVEQEDYQNILYEAYVNKPAKTLNQAITQQTELTNRLLNLRKQFNKGLIGEDEFGRKRGTIYGALDAVKNQISLLQKTPASTTAAAAMGGAPTAAPTTKGGTGTNIVESRGVQNFNISIKEFGAVTLNTTNIKEGANQIKEQVAQALIEAVNDFQLMATK